MIYEKLLELGFKFTKNPPKGSTMLFPNGDFLDLYENRELLGLKTKREQLIHHDLEDLLLKKGICSYKDCAERLTTPGCNKKLFISTDNAIYMQDGTNWYFENCYLELPKERITEEQEKSLLLWLDNLFYNVKLKNKELQVVKDKRIIYFNYNDKEFISEDIIKKIKMLYRG